MSEERNFVNNRNILEILEKQLNINIVVLFVICRQFREKSVYAHILFAIKYKQVCICNT